MHFQSIVPSIARAAFVPSTAIGILSLLAAGPAPGATRVWFGGAADDKWSTPGNWIGVTVPATGDSVEFPAGPVDKATGLDLLDIPGTPASGFTVGQVLFSAPGYSVTGAWPLRFANPGAPGLVNSFTAEGTSTVSVPVVLEADGVRINSGPGPRSVLQLTAPLYFNNHPLTVAGDGVTDLAQISAKGVGAGGSLTKLGSGAARIRGSSSWRGTMRVVEGTLSVEGTLVPAAGSTGNVLVEALGTLRGTGTVSADVAVQDGTVAPGLATTPGRLSVGGLGLSSGLGRPRAVFRLAGAGSYDRIVAGGPVAVGGAELQLTVGNGFEAEPGLAFTLVEKATPGAIGGTFFGVPEGGVVVAGAWAFRISYTGGSGNDITATVVPVPATGVSRVWTGLGANPNWSNPANWATGAPQPGDSVVFPAGVAAGRRTAACDLPDLATIGGVRIEDGGYSIVDATPGGRGVFLHSGITNEAAATTDNAWAVPITLAGNATLWQKSEAVFTISSPVDNAAHQLELRVEPAGDALPRLAVTTGISGGGPLLKSGPGTAGFSGSTPNSYTGVTRIVDGSLVLGKSDGVLAVPGAVEVDGASGSYGYVLTYQNGASLASAAVDLGSYGGWFVATGSTEALGAVSLEGFSFLDPAGTLTLKRSLTVPSGQPSVTQSGTLKLDPPGSGPREFPLDVAAGAKLTMFRLAPGTLAGDAGVTLAKRGDGTLVVGAPGTSTLEGLRVAGGAVEWNGSGSTISVSLDGGTLAGAGGTVGPVSAEAAGGALAPGPAAGGIGELHCAGLDIGSAVQVVLDVDGPVSALHDTLRVTGPVRLGRAELVLDVPPTFSAGTGNAILLIDNDGNDPVEGIFAGLPEGSVIVAGETRLQITYTAGPGGNDISLTVLPPPSQTTLVWDGGGPNNNWSPANNWSPDAAPVGGETLAFNAASARTTANNNLASNLVFRAAGISGALAAGGFSVTGAAVDLEEGLTSTATTGGSDTVTWSAPLRLTAPQAFEVSGSADLIIAGGVDLQDKDLTLRSAGPADDPSLAVTGIVSGTGGVTKAGTDLAVLRGTASNTYTGPTVVKQGELRLAKTGTNIAVAGDLYVGTGTFDALLTTTLAEKIADTAALTLRHRGTFSPAADETVGSLRLEGGTYAPTAGARLRLPGPLTAMAKTVSLLNGPIDLPGLSGVRQWTMGTGAEVTVTSALSRSGPVTVALSGRGLLRFFGPVDIGSVSVDGTTVVVDGAADPTAFAFNGSTPGAVLGGTGSTGAATFSATVACTVSPALAGTGVLTCASVSLGAATSLVIDLGAASADRLVSHGPTVLGGASLVVRASDGYPSVGDVLRIVEKTAAGSVAGALKYSGNSLAEGASFSTPVGTFRISYTGGDGNDVTLTVLQPASTGLTRTWTGLGADAKWSTAANWESDTPPGPGDSVLVPSSARQLENNNDMVGLVLQGLGLVGGSSDPIRTFGQELGVMGDLACSVNGSTEKSVVLQCPVVLYAGSRLVSTGARTLRLNDAALRTATACRGGGEIEIARAGGPGGLTVQENTRLVFSTGDANAFAGAVTVTWGDVRCAPGVEVVKFPGSVTVGGGTNPASARILAGQAATTSVIACSVNGTLTLGAADISALDVSGGSLELLDIARIRERIDVAGTDVSTDQGFEFPGGPGFIKPLAIASGASLTVAQLGSAGLDERVSKNLPGRLVVTRNLLVDQATLKAGELHTAATDGGGTAFFLDGGTLSGDGVVGGITALAGGGTVRPFTETTNRGTARLQSQGPVVLNAASRLELKLAGTAAITGYSQLASGGLTLDGAALALTFGGSFSPAAGQTFTLCRNDGAGATVPAFAGLAVPANPGLDARLVVEGQAFSLTYAGGDGNDIVLICHGPDDTPAEVSAYIVSPNSNDPNTMIHNVVANAIPGQTWKLQKSVSLTGWTDVVGATIPRSGQLTFVGTVPRATARQFFRLIRVP